MRKVIFFSWIAILLLTAACSGRSGVSTTIAPSPSVTLSAMPVMGTPTDSSTISAIPTLTTSLVPTDPIPQGQPLFDITEEIPAPSLEGNLLGDPTSQPLRVLLPPSYANSDRRYPVVYFLPGFGSSIEDDYYPQQTLADMMRSGIIQEMILVIPNGQNAFTGSFYVNSSVTGNWEDFIVRDVVGYVDQNYRTVPTAAARGIAGHSMGGFGALNLAMRHPGLFGAVYALNPGLFDENGLAETKTFDSPRRIEAFLEELDSLAGLPLEKAIRKIQHVNSTQLFSFAYGVAFAPNPNTTPPYFDFPYKARGDQLVRDEEIWQRWQSGLGDWKAKIQQYKSTLLQVNGIVIDYGEQDSLTWIPKGCRYVSRLLNAAGIDHQRIAEERGHADDLTERIVGLMLPFFSDRLNAQ